MNYGVLCPTTLLKQTLDAILHFLFPILCQLQISMFLGCLTVFSHRSIFHPSSSVLSFIISTELAKSTRKQFRYTAFSSRREKERSILKMVRWAVDVNTKKPITKCKLSKMKRRNLHCFSLLAIQIKTSQNRNEISKQEG